jgi:ABC-type transport system substrate-binding protein
MVADGLHGRRLGSFVLVEPLGAGSYATVWRARQARLDRDVAVKVLDPQVARNPTAARRFEREGRAAASLDHPAIVPVYEAGDADGLYYLAMRLVSGRTLADLIADEAPLAADRVAELLRPIGQALDHAHARGLIHRDVKPANILIEGDRPFLTDFGIAASARELGRYTTGSLGTAEYMAPEQAQTGEIDHRADLYSLGCVAYHALTGHPPFERPDVVATLVAHAHDPVPATGSAALDTFFATALAKQPGDRFGSATELVDALARAAAVQAARPPRRRRRLVAGLVLAGVALAAGGVLVAVNHESPDRAGTPAATAPPATTGTTSSSGRAIASPPTTSPAAVVTSVAATTVTSSVAPLVGPTPALQDGGNLVVGTNWEITDVNPHRDTVAAQVLAQWVLPVMYRIDEHLDAVPSLATGPPVPVDGDPLTLMWELRADQSWDDGTPVTAADLVATYEYLSDPATNATNTTLYANLAAVEAVDEHTVTLRLAGPLGAAHLLFSQLHPVIPAADWEAHLAAGGTAADFLAGGVTASAGPYRVADRSTAGQLILSPNPRWRGEPAPHLDRIDIVSYDDRSAVVEALRLEEIDVAWLDAVGRDELLLARELPDTTVEVGPSVVSVQITVNTRTGPLADPSIRRAVLHAIDRATLADSVLTPRTGELATTWDSLVFAPGQQGNLAPFTELFDPTEAERLLEAAGWVRPSPELPRQRGGEVLTVDVVAPDLAPLTNVVIAAGNDLAAVGFDVQARELPTDSYNAALAGGEFGLAAEFRRFNSDPIVTQYLFGTVDPSGIPTDAPAGFADPEIDALFAAANTERDPDTRTAIFSEIDALLAERVPAVPLFVLPAFVAYADDVTGIELATGSGPFVSLVDWALLAG